MKNKPLVSIIINCYNSDKYLKETIDSVISQTYKNWEIIFWDNQSIDNSEGIVNSYNDKRIKYYYAPKHTSLGEGRNEALKKVSGDFFKFLDADDCLYPNCIEKSIVEFEGDGVLFVYTNSHIYNQAKDTFKVNDKHIRPSGSIFQSWLSDYNVLLPSVTVRTSVLKRLGHHFDTRFSMIEEYDFFLRIAKLGKGKYLKSVSSFWRKHSDSLSFVKRNDWLVEFRMLHEKLCCLYPELSQSKELFSIEQHIAYLEFISCLVNDGIVKRELLRPYIRANKKCLLTYVTSFLGPKITTFLLKIIRKNI